MNKDLNKDKLGIKISENYDLPKNKSRDIVDFVFDEIIDTLAGNGEVAIYNFGKFKVRHRPKRKGFNPSTKKDMMIEASDVPVFEPGKKLREAVESGGH